MENTARDHEAELEALRAVNAPLVDGLLGELQHLRSEVAHLKHTLERLKHRLYGRSSEKIDPNQLELGLQIEAAAAVAAEGLVTVKRHPPLRIKATSRITHLPSGELTKLQGLRLDPPFFGDGQACGQPC